jgi:aminomethyltransferase
VLRPITAGADIDALRYFRFVTDGVTVGGVPVWLSRTGYSGELGFELYCRPEDASELWHAVLRAGEPHGLKPIGLTALETLRIEAGLLFPDIDYIARQTDPFEVRFDKLIRFDKPGDFVGRDALERIAAEGTAAVVDDAADRRR